jgi:hypothetical protein
VRVGCSRKSCWARSQNRVLMGVWFFVVIWIL